MVMKSDLAAGYSDFDVDVGISRSRRKQARRARVRLRDAENYTAVSDQSAALLEVESGSADACVIDATMAAAMTGAGTSYADLTVAAELTNEQYGVAFRGGSDLCAGAELLHEGCEG